MSIVISSTTRQTRPNVIVLNGHRVEEVNQFTYLGGEICEDDGSDADVDCRVRQAKGAFGIWSPIWRNSSFPSLKVRIFKSNVSNQFYCMIQALGKSPNQSQPNFKSL